MYHKGTMKYSTERNAAPMIQLWFVDCDLKDTDGGDIEITTGPL